VRRRPVPTLTQTDMHTSPEPMPHKEPLWKRESKAASNVKRNQAIPRQRRYSSRRHKDKIRPKRLTRFFNLGGPKEPAFPKRRK